MSYNLKIILINDWLNAEWKVFDWSMFYRERDATSFIPLIKTHQYTSKFHSFFKYTPQLVSTMLALWVPITLISKIINFLNIRKILYWSYERIQFQSEIVQMTLKSPLINITRKMINCWMLAMRPMKINWQAPILLLMCVNCRSASLCLV